MRPAVATAHPSGRAGATAAPRRVRAAAFAAPAPAAAPACPWPQPPAGDWGWIATDNDAPAGRTLGARLATLGTKVGRHWRPRGPRGGWAPAGRPVPRGGLP
jgi:hypothetical protein